MENMAASSFKRSLFVLRTSSIGSRRAGSRKVHFCKEGIFFLAENILWEKTFWEVLDQNLLKAGAATVH